MACDGYTVMTKGQGSHSQFKNAMVVFVFVGFATPTGMYTHFQGKLCHGVPEVQTV